MNATTRALNPELFPPNPAQKLLDGIERANASNDGRPFEKEMEITAGGYHSRRKAVLKKVSPPTRIVFYRDEKTGEKRQRVIMLENPFLDFVGVWTERNGLALMIEAKSTSMHRLPFNGDKGFHAGQWAAMKTWRLNGAATALVWKFNGSVCLYTPEMLLEAERLAVKSLAHENGISVPPGEGTVLWDFLRVMESRFWPPPQ